MEPRDPQPFGNRNNTGVRNVRRQQEDTDYLLDFDEDEFSQDHESNWDEARVSEEEPEWIDSDDEKRLEKHTD